MQRCEPVRSILIDAVGAPGQRTFYLQVQLRGGDRVILLLEKAQAIIIVDQIATLLEHIRRAFPAVLALSAMSAGGVPVLQNPEPVLFRAGHFALQYDPAFDLVGFQVSELRAEGQGEPQICRWWLTRQQLNAFDEMTRRVIRSGIATQMA